MTSLDLARGGGAILFCGLVWFGAGLLVALFDLPASIDAAWIALAGGALATLGAALIGFAPEDESMAKTAEDLE